VADAETTAALGEIKVLIRDAEASSQRRSETLHNKIDAVRDASSMEGRTLALGLERVATAFGGHAEQNEKDLIDVRRRLDRHDARWWKVVSGGAASGGILAGVIEFLSRGKGG
jgi:hypothetical protein